MDWRLGEKYFAQMLTDYDPSVNNGNWQWIELSTGTDPKPYFQRLFNPMLQSQKFDADAIYIKKWLPQLKDIPGKELHDWSKHYEKYNLQDIKYVKPIVEYKDARKASVWKCIGPYYPSKTLIYYFFFLRINSYVDEEYFN